MNTRYRFYSLLIAASAVIAALAAAVLVLLIIRGETDLALLATVTGLAWLSISLLLYRERSLVKYLASAEAAMGITQLAGDVPQLIPVMLRDFQQYRRVAMLAFASQEEARTQAQAPSRISVSTNDSSSRELTLHLRRIAALAKGELDANAVEISLYDEVADLWSQAFLEGVPRSCETQSMLVQAEGRPREAALDCRDDSVIVAPLLIAGKAFGALRVELQEGQTASEKQEELVSLLAMQGALRLVDARFTDEILRYRRASEESVRAKTGFLANLSHEIRGPLAIILNGVELLIEGLCGEITDQQRQTLNMIKGSGDHLLDLVNDVLDYAKVEAGKITAKPVEIIARELLEDLVAVVRSQAIEKKHTLTLVDIDDGMGILCDKRHARQMIINFLTNAVKYTPDGGQITVTAQRYAGDRVKISVADTGIGIADSQKEKVFAAFERVEDEYALKQMGTGLGMPLTRKLAEVNGGIAGFESEQGKGSTFWIVLPGCEIEKTEVSPEVVENAELLSPQGNGETVLIVDSDLSSREMLSRYLERQGFAVFEAQSSREVLRGLRDRRVQLAIIENDIPGQPGEEVVATIRSVPGGGAIPIILLSAKAFIFDIERFLKLGVDRCLSKPISLSEIALTTRRLIDETGSNNQSQVPASSEAPPA